MFQCAESADLLELFCMIVGTILTVFAFGCKKCPDAVQLEILICSVRWICHEEFAAAVFPYWAVVFQCLSSQIQAIYRIEDTYTFLAPAHIDLAEWLVRKIFRPVHRVYLGRAGLSFLDGICQHCAERFYICRSVKSCDERYSKFLLFHIVLTLKTLHVRKLLIIAIEGKEFFVFAALYDMAFVHYDNLI